MDHAILWGWPQQHGNKDARHRTRVRVDDRIINDILLAELIVKVDGLRMEEASLDPNGEGCALPCVRPPTWTLPYPRSKPTAKKRLRLTARQQRAGGRPQKTTHRSCYECGRRCFPQQRCRGRSRTCSDPRIGVDTAAPSHGTARLPDDPAAAAHLPEYPAPLPLTSPSTTRPCRCSRT